MKKSYKKILIFEFIMSVLLFLNSFVSSILSNYGIVVFLIILLICFKKLFGFEKKKFRYAKDILIEVLIFLLEFFLLYYLFGIITGFVRMENYFTWYALRMIVFPIVLTVILTEILRYMVVTKVEGSRLLLITTYILFVMLSISTTIYYTDFNSKYNVFIFFAVTLLPALTSNILCTYLTTKCNYLPSMFYNLVMRTYMYILPIVPNFSDYLSSVVRFVAPLILTYRIYCFFQRDRDDELDRDYRKRHAWYLLYPTVVIVVLVYFTSGYFRYEAFAVASGSMSPAISKGDAVIVEKVRGKYSELKKGDVIAYRYDNVVIVHRLSRILNEDGEYFFYTKGDANKEEDNFVITEKMIIGKVKLKLLYLGLPTVWLNEL